MNASGDLTPVGMVADTAVDVVDVTGRVDKIRDAGAVRARRS